MARGKHTKAQEEAYRRGYHQAISEALRLLESGVEQRVAPEQILDLFQEWEQKLATWRGALEMDRLLDPPPAAGGPRLRLVKAEQEEDEEEDMPEDERVDPRLRAIISRIRGIPRWQVQLSRTFADLRMTGIPNLIYLSEAMTEIEKAFGILFGEEALERFSYGSVGELQAYLEEEEENKALAFSHQEPTADQPRSLPDKTAARAAVATLQTRLHEAFAGTEFFVRASIQHGTAKRFRGYQITVLWTDGPSQNQVEVICGDLAQQVNINRLYSVEFLRQVATPLFRSYGLPTEQIEIGTHESSGSAYIVPANWQFIPGVGHIDQVLYRQLKEIAQENQQKMLREDGK
jgi:hypothetical protein